MNVTRSQFKTADISSKNTTRKGNEIMKSITKEFLFDINNPRLNVLLEESLKNNMVSVVGAIGNVGDTDLLSKMYCVRHEIGDKNNYEVHEHYSDDGVNFTASVSFIKKPSK